jgi:hypothetical protein
MHEWHHPLNFIDCAAAHTCRRTFNPRAEVQPADPQYRCLNPVSLNEQFFYDTERSFLSPPLQEEEERKVKAFSSQLIN